MFDILRNKTVVSEDGMFSGTIDIQGICHENMTSYPISIYSLFPLSQYIGCGIWTNDQGKEFEIFRINENDSCVHISSNCGRLSLKILNDRNSKDTIKISNIKDIMNDYAVMHITEDGWKIVDIFMFNYNFPDMTGYNTFAYKNKKIYKCKISMENHHIKYNIFE